MHVPFWADQQTLLQSVGLLLSAPGVPPTTLAGLRPQPGFNYVIGADQNTLPQLLAAVSGATTAVPFLVYLMANVTLTPAVLRAPGGPLPVNRPLLFVGRSGTPTSINWGMVPNSLALLGEHSAVTLSWVVLENLPPGDERSASLAKQYDVAVGYNVWPLLYQR